MPDPSIHYVEHPPPALMIKLPSMNISFVDRRTSSPAFNAPTCTMGKLVVVSVNALENTYKAFQKKHSWSPSCRAFNTTGHSLLDIVVRSLKSCNGSNLRRNQLEMENVCRLGISNHTSSTMFSISSGVYLFVEGRGYHVEGPFFLFFFFFKDLC